MSWRRKFFKVWFLYVYRAYKWLRSIVHIHKSCVLSWSQFEVRCLPLYVGNVLKRGGKRIGVWGRVKRRQEIVVSMSFSVCVCLSLCLSVSLSHFLAYFLLNCLQARAWKLKDCKSKDWSLLKVQAAMFWLLWLTQRSLQAGELNYISSHSLAMLCWQVH